MANKFKFTHEDLWRMYDEAMAWEPPSQSPQNDPRQVLQRLIGSRQMNNNGGPQVA